MNTELTEKFNEHGYVLVKNLLPDMLLQVAYEYVLMKASTHAGALGDDQVPNTFNMYGDPLLESLSTVVRLVVERVTGKQLWQTYTYCRLYKNGDTLAAHTDRLSCEISASLCVGLDVTRIQQHTPDYVWPIFMNGTAIAAAPGDLVLYQGCEVTHWREAFVGSWQAQVFLHYVDRSQPYAELLRFDTRPGLGLPASTKDRKKEFFAERVAHRLREKKDRLE